MSYPAPPIDGPLELDGLGTPRGHKRITVRVPVPPRAVLHLQDTLGID